MQYVFVTLEGGEGFETHREAWNVYENHDDEFRGVYRIFRESVEPINISGSFFDPRHDELKERAKTVANRHRRSNEQK